MALVLLKLGTGVLPEGGYTAYAVSDGSNLVDLYTAASDGQAIDHARDLASGRELECEPALASAALARGCPVRPLSAGEAADRAHFTMRVFAPDLLEGMTPGILTDFFEAAYVFVFGAAKDTRQWQFIADLRGTIGDTRMEDRLGLIVNTGATPGLSALDEQNLERLLEGEVGLDDVDRSVVRFEQEPAALAAALEQPYGLGFVPWPHIVSGGRAHAPSALEVETLAALMGMTGRHLSTGEMGMTWQPHLGGSLEVRLGVRGIAD